jgi:hypothetical protein
VRWREDYGRWLDERRRRGRERRRPVDSGEDAGWLRGLARGRGPGEPQQNGPDDDDHSRHDRRDGPNCGEIARHGSNAIVSGAAHRVFSRSLPPSVGPRTAPTKGNECKLAESIVGHRVRTSGECDSTTAGENALASPTGVRDLYRGRLIRVLVRFRRSSPCDGIDTSSISTTESERNDCSSGA